MTDAGLGPRRTGRFQMTTFPDAAAPACQPALLRSPAGNRSSMLRTFVLLGTASLILFAMPAWADCAHPANAIVAENCLTGNPSSDWDISGAGDLSIQGFATDISVNVGGT